MTLSTQKIQSPKFNQLMKTAEDLFMQYGIRRVSIEEICKTANVSKMTFYKFFRNKNDLALRLIINMLDEGQVAFDDIMSQNIPFAEKISQFIQLKLDYGKRFSKEFYQDIIGYTPEIHDLVLERSQQGIQQMKDLFREAQQKGELKKDLNLEFLSFMIDHLLELREDPRLLSIFPNMYELTRDWLNLFFYGVMAQDEQGNG
ncbi:MAG: TetR/AcrR family transcriptional regulator [Candidatus Marinimicrobia bacterium]|nr:TetR/AcrR family transcriptional regulator [Candidatus Neomarinimicrobiota bacterium]